MRHARDEYLDRLEPLLAAIRLRTGLVERKRGTFYRKGQAFLHFHEHAGQLLADLRADVGFTRFELVADQWQPLLAALDAQLSRR
ncbi:hypothetical protein [Chitinimonas sp.]|uniref:hypothetical protein n=1 Tax=Chitinimonas sp. TaxID=1934313 RepID=UPI002F95B1ED